MRSHWESDPIIGSTNSQMGYTLFSWLRGGLAL